MVSKKQTTFSQGLKRAMADAHLTQRQIADYLGTASSSISRKLNGKHPWTVDEQDKLSRWLHLDVIEKESLVVRDKDPALDAVDQVLLGLPKTERPDVYKTVVLVVKGKQHALNHEGQEAYRALCALVS